MKRIMISPECRYAEFLQKIRDKTPDEILEIAEREATLAERMRWRHGRLDSRAEHCGQDYAERLKQLIDYLRFSAKPRKPIADSAWLASVLGSSSPRPGQPQRGSHPPLFLLKKPSSPPRR